MFVVFQRAAFGIAMIEITLIDVSLPGRERRFIPEEFVLFPVGFNRFAEVAFCPSDDGNLFRFFARQ